MNSPAEVQTDKKIVWIIWTALLVSHFVYLGVLFYLGKLNEPINKDMTFVAIMGMMALSILFISEFFWKKVKSNAPRQGPSDTYSPKMFTNAIIAWALGESITIYGFVIGMLLKADLSIVYSFFALGIALHLYRKPK